MISCRFLEIDSKVWAELEETALSSSPERHIDGVRSNFFCSIYSSFGCKVRLSATISSENFLIKIEIWKCLDLLIFDLLY